MKRLRVWASVWLICLFALAACKEDDGYVYPSVLTEFIDARTDYSGTLFQLISDDGTILSIRQRSGLDGLVKDTVYRTVSVYEREGDGEVYLYSAQLVLSMFPVTEDYFKDDIKTDPVSLVLKPIVCAAASGLLAKYFAASSNFSFITHNIPRLAAVSAIP